MPDVKEAKGKEDQLIAAFKAEGLTLTISKNLLRDRTYTITYPAASGLEPTVIEDQVGMDAWLAANKLSLGYDKTKGTLKLIPTESAEEEAVQPDDGGAPAGPIIVIGSDGRPYMYIPPQAAQTDPVTGEIVKAATAEDWKALTPAKASTGEEPAFYTDEESGTRFYKSGDTGEWERVPTGPTKPGADKPVPDYGGTGRTAIVDENGQFQSWVPVAEEPAKGPSLQEQIDAAIANGDIQGAQRLYNFQNQESLRDQALRIGQSPGDWWTYYSRLYGDQPSVDFRLGERAIPGYAGGLLGDVQGQQQKPALGADSQAMDAYQARLDAQRNQRGADGLTTEERVRKEAGLDTPRALGGNAPTFGGQQSIGERERAQIPALDAIDRQIQALVAAGDTAETPEDQAAVQQRISELQAQRQQIWQGQQQRNAPTVGVGGQTDMVTSRRMLGDDTSSPQWKLDPTGNPNMVGIRNLATGQMQWVNKNDKSSVQAAWENAIGYKRPQPLGASNGSNGGGQMQWPSRGLADVSGGGQVSGQRLLPTLGAPRFLSPQTESGLTPSERGIYQSEVQNQGFNLPDYEEQKRKQFGGFAGGSAGGYGGGGSRGFAGRSLGR